MKITRHKVKEWILFGRLLKAKGNFHDYRSMYGNESDL